MTVELERVSIGGVWQWQAVSEGGSGGSVSEITSNDNSVTITDPTGPTVDLSVGGGSSPYAYVYETIDFDTPGILTGIPLYTPTIGDALLLNQSYMYLPTPWDATGSCLELFRDGDDPDGSNNLAGGLAIDSASTFAGPGTAYHDLTPFPGTMTDAGVLSGAGPIAGQGDLVRFDSTAALMLAVDDYNGGDPGATEGELRIFLTILKAPA